MISRDDIPEEFYRGDNHPRVETVGDLKEALKALPDDLTVLGDWASSDESTVQLIVYNITTDPFLSLEEVAEDYD